MTLQLDALSLLIAALATCYWAYAVTKTHGAFGIFETIRNHFPMGGLMNCPICLSFWLAIAFYVLMLTPLSPIVVMSAIAGLATLAGYYTGFWQQ